MIRLLDSEWERIRQHFPEENRPRYVSIAQVSVLVRHWDMSGGVESFLFGIAGGSMLCNFSQAGRSVACPTPRYKA